MILNFEKWSVAVYSSIESSTVKMFCFVILLITAITLIYFYVKYLYSYWERRGVKQLRPSFPFGNFSDSFLQKLSPAGQQHALYHSTSDPFIGVYMFFHPTLFVRDPNLVRTILIKVI